MRDLHALVAALLRTMRRHRMVSSGGRVVVALSGGPDSVALLHLLRELEAAGEVQVAGIAHFNHRLRGNDADEDERFCRELAAKLGRPIHVGSADVREVAAREKRSIEDAARRLRYGFFDAVLGVVGAEAVAVGHTRDDQAETLLLRLIRGSGTRGLGGIRPKAGRVIRPALDVSRAELRAFVVGRRLQFREDASNADLRIPRNRIRHELLPYLAREFAPRIVEVLAREAVLAQTDEACLERQAIELAASVVLSDTAEHAEGAPVVRLDAHRLRSADPALSSRVIRRALEVLAAGRSVEFDHVQRVMEFAAEGGRGSLLDLPGQQAVHEGESIRLQAAPPRGIQQAPNGFRIPLSIPGEAVLPSGIVLSAEWAGESRAGGTAATLVQGVRGGLSVRSRRPGDRFQPPGMGGRSRKLQDYFVDRKVARGDRDLVPLVVDDEDRIVWVVGHGVSDAFRAATPSPGVILLKARQLGGKG